MDKELIGHIDCHLCGTECPVYSSKKAKPYYTCGECGHQMFTRGPAAAAKLINSLKQEPDHEQQTSSEEESSQETSADSGAGNGGTAGDSSGTTGTGEGVDPKPRKSGIFGF